MTQPNPPLAHPAGHVDIQGDTATLRFERYYPHPPEKVWSALTDPAQLGSWFMTKATIDGRPGGSVEMISGPAQFHWTGQILQWEPYRVYEYEWNLPPHPHVPNGEASVVKWELFPEGEGTRLKLTHRSLTKGTALGFAPGTHAFLDRLGAQLDGSALPNWMQRYDEVKHAYPAWSLQA